MEPTGRPHIDNNSVIVSYECHRQTKISREICWGRLRLRGK